MDNKEVTNKNTNKIPINKYIHILKKSTKVLQFYGLIIFLFLLCNSATIILPLIIKNNPRFFIDEFNVLILSFVFTFFSIGLLYLYELSRKNNDSLFIEITDFLENNPTNQFSYISDLEIKIILRNYSKLVNLPLVDNKNGKTVYFLLNIMFLFSNLYITNFS